ncbi:MAG TPA: site-specific integrase [Ktedonobacteraceae bacterium]
MIDGVDDSASVQTDSDVVLVIRGAAVGIDVADRDHLLAAQQELLARASSAADEVARRDLFSRYRTGKAHHTIRLQTAALTCFMTYLEGAGVSLTSHLADEPRLWRAISYGLAEGFKHWMLHEGYSTKTVNDYLGVVKLYAKLAHRGELMEDHTYLAIAGIETIRGAEARRIDERRAKTRRKDPATGERRGKKLEATYLKTQQVHTLFVQPDVTTPQGWRDLVALLLLYDHGLRPSEAIALRFSDLDMEEGTVHVYRRKTHLEQRLLLTPPTRTALRSYLALRRDWHFYLQIPSPERDAPVLVQSRKSKKLVEQLDLIEAGKPGSADWSTQNLWERVHLLGEALGVNLASYDGRHQWARDAADDGTDYLKLIKAGGWKAGSRMVERYYGEKEIANEGVHLKR